MKDDELADLLRTFDDRLAHANSLNLKLAREVNVQRSVSVLKDLNSNRAFELVAGILVAVFLGNFIVDNRDSVSLVVSSAILLIFTFISIFGCIRQLILISRFDCSQTVAENQEALISMRTHHLKYLRLTILQVPFYMAYIVIGFKIAFGIEIWETGDRNWLWLNVLVGLVLAPFSIWLYRLIRINNLHVNWVRRLYELSGGDQITKAMQFLDGAKTN